jgi:dsRNA-specific ribonuclease
MTVAWNPDDCGDDNNLKISAVLDDDGNRFLTFIWDQGWSGCTPHYALCIAKKQKDKKSPVGLTDSERDRLGMYLKEDEVRKRGEKQSKKANGKAKEAGNKRKASEISSTPESNLVATMPDLPKLTTEIILDVFTHKSLQDQSHAPSQSERLAELGERVLELIVTDILFHQRPCLNATEIAVSHTSI